MWERGSVGTSVEAEIPAYGISTHEFETPFEREQIMVRSVIVRCIIARPVLDCR